MELKNSAFLHTCYTKAALDVGREGIFAFYRRQGQEGQWPLKSSRAWQRDGTCCSLGSGSVTATAELARI